MSAHGEDYEDPKVFFQEGDYDYYSNPQYDENGDLVEYDIPGRDEPEDTILEMMGAKPGPSDMEEGSVFYDLYSFLFMSKKILEEGTNNDKFQQRAACLHFTMCCGCLGMALSDLLLPITIRLRDMGVIIPISKGITLAYFLNVDAEKKYVKQLGYMMESGPSTWYKVWGQIKDLISDSHIVEDRVEILGLERMYNECVTLVDTMNSQNIKG